MENNPSSSRADDRKTIEKNRRNQMKALYSRLNSLVPCNSSMEAMSLPDQLDEATRYIKRLQTNLETMKEKKDNLMGINNQRTNGNKRTNNEITMELKSPQIEIFEKGSALEVVLVTGLDCQFMFNDIIKVLQEEGAELVHASFSVVNDTVLHTIYSEVKDSALGSRNSRISERLKKFVQDDNGM